MNTKLCKQCQQEKLVENFPVAKRYKDGLHPWCKECRRKYYKARYERINGPVRQKREQPYSPEERRNFNLKHLYGITLDDFDKMLVQQGGGCATCGKKASESTENFVVDHDHSCCPGGKSCGKCVRGILCRSCNTGLGYAKDNPIILRSMATYLETRFLVVQDFAFE